MGFNELENKMDDEVLTGDEAKVREMLAGLSRVEAPKDFGFKVQARIADSRPEDLRAKGSSWAFLKYAMPLAVVLLVMGGFVLNGLYSVDNTAVPSVADSSFVPSAPPGIPGPSANEVAVVPVPVSDKANSNTETAPKPGDELLARNPQKSSENKKVESDDQGGGSRDFGLSNSKQVFQIGPKPNSGPKAPGAGGQIAIRGILDMVGIKADPSGNGWTVNSVEPNSVAERSGVKRGDLIEAINGQPVTDNTQFGGSFNGKSLTIRRDGKTQEISLR